MDEGPLGTAENATTGKALTRTAQVYDPGERREMVRQKTGVWSSEQAFGHLTKVAGQMRQRRVADKGGRGEIRQGGQRVHSGGLVIWSVVENMLLVADTVKSPETT